MEYKKLPQNYISQMPKKKSKILGIPVLMFALICIGLVTLVSASILYHMITVDVTVNEALDSTTYLIDLPGATMGTFTENITVDNSADISLNTEVSWIESSNEGTINGTLVDYTTDMPKNVILAPGLNTITVEFVVANDSPVGDFGGNINLRRIA